MVSVDKIEKGLAAYLDAELMPQLQTTGVERVIVGTAASLMIRRTGAIVEGYKDNKMIKMLGIMDEAGNVDVDTVVAEVKKNIAKDGFVVDVPILGSLTFHKEDIDKLHRFITAEV